MARGEIKRAAATSLAVLAGIGFSALKPGTAGAAHCNIPQQIAQLENGVEHVRTFRQPALQPEHPHESDYVKVFAKKEPEASNDQFMIDPLVIKCGAQIVRYVGLTHDRNNTLGQRYTTTLQDPTRRIYMDVVDPADTTTQADIGLENAEGMGPRQDTLIAPMTTVHFGDAYDRSTDQYFPAFLGPDPANPLPLVDDEWHDVFGIMF